jgi:hypothetical protein
MFIALVLLDRSLGDAYFDFGRTGDNISLAYHAEASDCSYPGDDLFI